MNETPEQKWGHDLLKLRVGSRYRTQADLAKAAGLHASVISQLERGTRKPSLSVFEQLQAVLPKIREPKDWRPRAVKREAATAAAA